MRTQGKPGLWLGLWSGLFLTLPLVAIFYLGYRLTTLPFPPFSLFDWQTRILPGQILAKGMALRFLKPAIFLYQRIGRSQEEPSDGNARANLVVRRQGGPMVVHSTAD
jgi:hypothetical protein